MGILSFASLAVSLSVSPLLRLIASSEFSQASTVVPLVCLAYLVGGLANCLGNGLIVAGRVRLIAAYALLAGVTNLALNALLIPWIGIYGAAVATILAFAIQFGGILLSLSRHFPTRLEWNRIFGLAVSCLIPFLASLLLPSLPLAVDIFARMGLLAVCPLLIAMLRLVHPEEVAAVRRQVAAWRVLLWSSKPTPENTSQDN